MAKRIQDFRSFNSSKDTDNTPNITYEKKANITKNYKTKASNVKNNKTKEYKEAKKPVTTSRTTVKKTSNDKKRGVTVDTPKEKKSGNKFITTFFVLLILCGIIIGCLFSPTFNLTGIIVESGANVTSEEILNSFNVAKGTNVFKIDYKNIKKSVENLSYIQSAKAKLEIPSQIRIEYIERVPFALVKYLESYLVMDKYGYILEITREKKFESLPIIYNIEFESYEIGKQLDDTAKTKYDNVVYLLESASKNDFKYSISEINYQSISNVKMWVTEEDIEIIYGEIDKNLIVDKLNYISEILYRIKGKKGRIDISSDNYLEKTVFTERL